MLENGFAKEAVRIQVDQILRLLREDNHYWSERPCATCKTISTIIERPFGCYEYAARRKKAKEG